MVLAARCRLSTALHESSITTASGNSMLAGNCCSAAQTAAQGGWHQTREPATQESQLPSWRRGICSCFWISGGKSEQQHKAASHQKSRQLPSGRLGICSWLLEGSLAATSWQQLWQCPATQSTRKWRWSRFSVVAAAQQSWCRNSGGRPLNVAAVAVVAPAEEGCTGSAAAVAAAAQPPAWWPGRHTWSRCRLRSSLLNSWAAAAGQWSGSRGSCCSCGHGHPTRSEGPAAGGRSGAARSQRGHTDAKGAITTNQALKGTTNRSFTDELLDPGWRKL
jgi:hypothetical protein